MRQQSSTQYTMKENWTKNKEAGTDDHKKKHAKSITNRKSNLNTNPTLNSVNSNSQLPQGQISVPKQSNENGAHEDKN